MIDHNKENNGVEPNLRLSDSTLPSWALGKPAAKDNRKAVPKVAGRWGQV
jgi:hypothetical protein